MESSNFALLPIPFLGPSLQVADPHAPGLSNGRAEENESEENIVDLMSQLNALSSKS